MVDHTRMFENLLDICARDGYEIKKIDFEYEIAIVYEKDKQMKYTMDWCRLKKRWIHI